jgi:hypothetical protein
MSLSRLSASDFNRRPIDRQGSRTVPLTEWAYEAKHAGERPRLDWSSSSSEIAGADSDSDAGTDRPAGGGSGLESSLAALSASHLRMESRMAARRAAARAAIAQFRFAYLEDIPSDDAAPAPARGAPPAAPAAEAPARRIPARTALRIRGPADPASRAARRIAARTAELRKRKDGRAPREGSSDGEAADERAAWVRRTEAARRMAKRTAELRELKTPRDDPLGTEEELVQACMAVRRQKVESVKSEMEREARPIVTAELTDLGSTASDFLSGSPRAKRAGGEEGGLSKSELDRRRFYDTRETHAAKLRNQRTRQRMALEHERRRVETEEESARKDRRRAAGRRIEPELKRLAAVSEERRRLAGRGVHAEKKTVEDLRRIMRNVEGAEAMLRRNERAMAVEDIRNRERKEEIEMERQAELQRLQRRNYG